MKVCPTCDRTYYDDELNFCLMCGVPLSDGAAQPTVMIPGSGEATVVLDPRATVADNDDKPRGLLFYLGVTVASIVGVMGIVLGAFTIYFMVTDDDPGPNDRTANNRPAVTVKTPERPTPKQSPSPSVPTPSPTPTPIDENEVVTLNWSQTALEFKASVDVSRSFECPSDGTESTIFGSVIYAANSSICTAAVHAGKIDMDKGGEVTIRFRPGQKHYESLKRNDITSLMFGTEELSFVFE